MGMDVLGWVAALLLGMVMGGIFFGGLWATVRALHSARHPALLMLASLLLRFGAVLVGFYLLIEYGGWDYALVATVGLVSARWWLVKRYGPLAPKAISKGVL